MLGVDRRTGSAAQGSTLCLPADVSLCSACLPCRGDIFGVINMLLPAADTFFFSLFFGRKCRVCLQSELPCQLETVKVSCGDILFWQTWVLFHLRLSKDLWFIVQLSQRGQQHMPGILCSGGKDTLPGPLMVTGGLSPYKGRLWSHSQKGQFF